MKKSNRIPLQKKTYRAIILVATALILLVSLVVFILYTYVVMQDYKLDTTREMKYVLSLMDQDYLKEIYTKLKETYESVSEDIAADPFKEEYYDYFWLSAVYSG